MEWYGNEIMLEWTDEQVERNMNRFIESEDRAAKNYWDAVIQW